MRSAFASEAALEDLGEFVEELSEAFVKAADDFRSRKEQSKRLLDSMEEDGRSGNEEPEDQRRKQVEENSKALENAKVDVGE